MNRKKFLALSCCILALVLFGTGCLLSPVIGGVVYENADEYVVGNASYDDLPRTIKICWTVGSVEIVRTDESRVTLTEADDGLKEDEKMRSLNRDGTLTVRFWKSGKRGRIDSERKKLTVSLPEGISVLLETVSANVNACDLVCPTVSVKNVSGEIFLGDVTADDLTVETVSGSFRADEVRTENVSAYTVSGSLSFRSLKTGTFTVESVSADLSVQDLSTDVVAAETVSGKIRFRATLCGSADLETVSGDCILEKVASLGMTVDFHSSSGRLISSLPRTEENGKHVFGDGNCKVRFRSTSGNLTVSDAG
ncbi:MAG: DUF4097 family beta strand repeat-containing protein [Candidatus Borkfalkiaceae bacterium]|nr:DUF4097 family beta strand repeat-containing protein [Christensenellaceae bacterium]